MAHWTSTSHENDVPEYTPPKVMPPRRIRCGECTAVFRDYRGLNDHRFAAHPVRRPRLLYRGRECGDSRIVIPQSTGPLDWRLDGCKTLRANGIEVDAADVGAHMSRERGIVEVEFEFPGGAQRCEFDIAVVLPADLAGVDAALWRLLDGPGVSQGTISEFYESTADFASAREYAGHIAEYLYWFADRNLDIEPTTSHHDKLNRAASYLDALDEPVALAITGLISFYFNHFIDAAAHCVPGQLLENLSLRLEELLTARCEPRPLPSVVGELSLVERRLLDDRTGALLRLISGPLGQDFPVEADESAWSGDDFDRFKVILFTAEHHLARRDGSAARVLRRASQNGRWERWVNARLDYLERD